MPNFYKGYDKYLDLTEEEYWDQRYYDSEGEYSERILYTEQAQIDLEGEPYEDAYFSGIPDYDRFNRPSWEEKE